MREGRVEAGTKYVERNRHGWHVQALFADKIAIGIAGNKKLRPQSAKLALACALAIGEGTIDRVPADLVNEAFGHVCVQALAALR